MQEAKALGGRQSFLSLHQHQTRNSLGTGGLNMALSQTPGHLQLRHQGRDPIFLFLSAPRLVAPGSSLTGMAREETSTQEGQVGTTDSDSSSGRRNGATFQTVMPPKFIFELKCPPSWRQRSVFKNLYACNRLVETR